MNEITTSCATPRNDKYVSEAHRKELNVLTSYRLNDFKKKAGATHVDMSANIRRAAFTLAEVLITLGIIGVVAAMTIPTLIADYQEKQTVTKLTKAYATLNNAYQMAKVENGELRSWGFTNNAGEIDTDENGNPIQNEYNEINRNLFWKTLSPYIKAHIETITEYTYYYLGGRERTSTTSFQAFNLSDGTTFHGGYISNYQCQDNQRCGDLVVDINGLNTPPNTLGKDMFAFSIYGSGIVPMGNQTDKGNTFEKYCDRDNNNLLHNGYGCSAWVIYNKNMDYLHCDDLAWDGKHKCSD